MLSAYSWGLLEGSGPGTLGRTLLGRSCRLAAGIFIGCLEKQAARRRALGQHGLHGLFATGFTGWRTAAGCAAAITTAASGTDLVGRTGWREITGCGAGSAREAGAGCVCCSFAGIASVSRGCAGLGVSCFAD
jgi:hypothetical protein